ncbi:MAG: hypothetical protein C0421_10830 [Hyphomonas sp.]|nr:hypothetical protein [Hyphomonas sp.]
MPEGEQLLWQGSPGTLAFAIHAFHIRFVLGYFVLATSWRLANMDTAGATGLEMTRVAINSGIGAAAGIGLLVLIAWAMARATVYTVTSKRVVLRYGVAIRKYVNLPFDQIASADMRRYGKDKGDIVLSLASAGGLAYMRLWPHVRPLRINRPQPMFRGLTGVDAVARTLASAITAHAPNRVTQATVAAPARPTLTAPGLAASAT